MSNVRVDYTGQKFNHLTILGDVEDRVTKSGQKIRRVNAICDCGSTTIYSYDLREIICGNTKGCKECRAERHSIDRKLPFNQYKIDGDKVYIYHDTIPDFYTIIDLKWLDYFKNYHLGCTPNVPEDSYWYIMQNGKRKKIHQIICGYRADHIDGDKNNNQESNLRKCTHQENNLNRRGNYNNKAGYKGVTTCSRLKKKKYCAKIEHLGKQYNLGYYEKPEDAAKAYDRKAIELFGEFAWTNFPRSNYE